MTAFAGKSVAVTGGAAGIGAAVVDRFLAAGASVAILDRSIDATHDRRARFGDRLIVQAGDVRSYADNRALVDATLAAFGRLDVFIGNAGIYDGKKPVTEYTGEALSDACDELFAVDVKGYVLGARAAIDALRASGGSIIFTASVSAFHPAFGGALYVAAKHAITGLTKRLALEFAPEVRVNAVAPGYVVSNLANATAVGPMPPAAPISAGSFPGDRFPEPDDYAGLYTFLASEDARAVTGATLLADWGSSLRR